MDVKFVSAYDYKWSGSSIKLLLSLYKERKRDLSDRRLKKKNVWLQIAKEMEKKDVKGIDAEKVERKFRNLKHTYTKIRIKNRSTKWEYFNEMEDIYGGDKQLSIVGASTISSFSQDNSDDAMVNESDNIEISSVTDDDGTDDKSVENECNNVAKTSVIKTRRSFAQKEQYTHTKQIIAIEFRFTRMADAMEESNRLFRNYITALERQNEQI